MSHEVIDSDKHIGLTDREKSHVADINRKIMQNCATAKDIEYLSVYRRKDALGIVSQQLDSVSLHPSFTNPDTIVENVQKNALLHIKIEDTRNKSKLQNVQGQQISMKMINSMLRADKPEDGKKFGIKEIPVIQSDDIDVTPEYDPVVEIYKDED
jgi:hypothetical protein